MSYHKLWFGSKKHGETAGIVVSHTWVITHAANLIPEASRLFPRSEFRKLEKMYMSPEFNSWDEAFAFKVGE